MTSFKIRKPSFSFTSMIKNHILANKVRKFNNENKSYRSFTIENLKFIHGKFSFVQTFSSLKIYFSILKKLSTKFNAVADEKSET